MSTDTKSLDDLYDTESAITEAQKRAYEFLRDVMKSDPSAPKAQKPVPKDSNSLPAESRYSLSEAVEAQRYLSGQIKQYTEKINRVQTVKSYIDSNTTFKVGDVAFHKDFGNVLIRDIHISYSWTNDQIENPFISYSVWTQKESERVYADSLVPITEATKILFNKKNNE